MCLTWRGKQQQPTSAFSSWQKPTRRKMVRRILEKLMRSTDQRVACLKRTKNATSWPNAVWHRRSLWFANVQQIAINVSSQPRIRFDSQVYNDSAHIHGPLGYSNLFHSLMFIEIRSKCPSASHTGFGPMIAINAIDSEASLKYSSNACTFSWQLGALRYAKEDKNLSLALF